MRIPVGGGEVWEHRRLWAAVLSLDQSDPDSSAHAAGCGQTGFHGGREKDCWAEI